jgi:predicted N-acetyltransferase YhbS
MIGDPGYYGRFGFIASSTAGWRLPGPVEPSRLLLRNDYGQILPGEGDLQPVTVK